jgi:hypothetical protein
MGKGRTTTWGEGKKGQDSLKKIGGGGVKGGYKTRSGTTPGGRPYFVKKNDKSSEVRVGSHGSFKGDGSTTYGKKPWNYKINTATGKILDKSYTKPVVKKAPKK